MASASPSSMYECPVCTEEFTQPKILPCAHLICRKCILSWAKKGKGQTTCPLCRAPILSPARQGQSDLTALIDSLPTDLAVMSLIDSQKVLLGPHVCTMCQNNVTATSYCFECEIKLCNSCTTYHRNLPATKMHNLEQLSKLTAKQLAANCRSPCKTHPNRSAELYCPTHKELICILCGTTSHGNCGDKQTVEDVATEKRRELEQLAKRLRKKEADISKQIKEDNDEFKVMQRKVKDTFDDLQQCLEKRRQEVYKQIQTRKDASVTSQRELERLKTDLASNAASVENLVDSAPVGALLSMLQNMATRLNDLESQSGTTNKFTVVDFILDPPKLNQLKADIASLGRIETPVTTPTPTETPVTASKPRRAELARVLKDKGGPGTVTAIPSRILAAEGCDPQGVMDVRKMAVSSLVTAASAAISAGSSLAGTTIWAMNQGTGLSVSCGIEVENWSRFPLVSPKCTTVDGQVAVPPTSILPGKREAMVAHKTGGTATGTYGTVSWLVGGKNRRLVVMWSAPFNHDYHSNWLAVGFTDTGVTKDPNDSSWFNQMYYEGSGKRLSFFRGEFYRSSNALTFSSGGLEVEGTMGTSHLPTVKIIMRPVHNDDLFTGIKAVLAK